MSPATARPALAAFDAAAHATVYRPPPAAGSPRACAACAVCGGALPVGTVPPRHTAAGPRPAPVCGPACARRLAAVPARQRCAACGRPIAVGEWAVGACADPACRHEVLVAGPARARAAVAAVLEADAERARDRAVAALGARAAPADVPAVLVPGRNPHVFPLSVAPGDGRPPARLPRRRRRALAAHLRAMTRLALAGRAAGTLRPCTGTAGEPGDAPAGAEAAIQAAANQEEAAVLAGACAACGGRCCRAGGDVAYLTADTVGDFVDAHPRIDGRGVVAAYLARVPELTVPGSCVYHGAAGCGLPREMRSVVCNRFLCDGLVELRALVRRQDEARPGLAGRDPGDPAPAAYLAVVTDGRVGRGALTLASADPIA